MRQLFFVLFTCLLLTANAQERITRFHSNLQINSDCSVDITERIDVVCEGNRIRHGIFREIPLSYDYQGGRTTVEFTLIGIKQDGIPADYSTVSASNGIRIYIGNEDRLLKPGKHQYQIHYRVNWVLNIDRKEADELYWNINGTGCDFTIDSLTASVHLPQKAKLLDFAAYTGRAGSRAQDYKAQPISDGLFFYARSPMKPHENMTVSVSWSKNALTYPSDAAQHWYWTKSHMLLLVSIAGFLLLFVSNFRTWYRHGRDPKPGTIMPQYTPPAGFSPAECAYVYHHGRKENAVFTAQLIGLAAKGCMTIDTDSSGSVFSKRSYTFTRKEPENDRKPLFPIEQQFLQHFFHSENTVFFQEKTYNPHLKNAREALMTSIASAHGERFHRKRTRFKWRQYLYLLLILIAGIAAKLLFGGNGFILVFLAAAGIIMNIIFGFLYEQPTPEGRTILDHLEGFRSYMRFADKERIRLNNPPDMSFDHFEENLPYAIALGVASEWAGQFDLKELERQTSSTAFWYHGAALSSAGAFDFGSLSGTISSASTPPESSSGSGGGGFSGGGGGGGGTGGW